MWINYTKIWKTYKAYVWIRFVYQQNQQNNVTSSEVSTTLETMKITLAQMPLSANNQQSVKQWIAYIGNKYSCLKSLEISYARDRPDESSVLNFEDAIIQTVQSKQLSKLKNYKMILCPMTKKILQAMYCSSIGLECITLWGDSNGKHCLKEQLECLGYSRQIKSIRSVSLYLRERDGDNSAGLLRQSMKLFSRQASHLVALEFKRDIYSMNPPFNGLLLVDDITNFASLESLHTQQIHAKIIGESKLKTCSILAYKL
jgi:hypothetical protein